MTGPISIVVPFKDPAGAKRRLAPALDREQRAALAWALLEQTLSVLATHFPERRLEVVTNAATLRAPRGVAVLRQVREGLNGALEDAAAWSTRRGFASMLVIPADIATLDPDEVAYLLRQPRPAQSLQICPSVDGGTNALLVTPPTALPFSFGPESCAAHAAIAKARNMATTVHDLPHLAHDIDTPADLAWLANAAHRGAAFDLMAQWTDHARS